MSESPTIKHRIIDKATGKIIAYEWVDETGWRWKQHDGKYKWFGSCKYDNVSRERFVCMDGDAEIYENDLLGNGESEYEVYWSGTGFLARTHNISAIADIEFLLENKFKVTGRKTPNEK